MNAKVAYITFGCMEVGPTSFCARYCYTFAYVIVLAVVKKLLNADIKFEGKSLIIERCKPQTDATQIARPSVKCRAPPPPVKQKPKLQGEFVATRRTQKAPPPPVAPKRADKQADFDGTNFGRNNNCRMVAAEQPSPSSETDPVCQDNDYEQWESVEEDDDGEISVSSQPTQHVVVAAAAAAGEQLEKLSLKPPVEEERHVTERVASDKHTSQREIELPEPKLKLLQKLQLAKKIDFECELSFDFAKGIVVLPETCGNTVERIYELLVAAVCKRVNLEIDAGEFFSVAERMTWLETWLKNSCPELTAVTYLEKSILYVLTACENTSMEIAKVLESSFASETVEIEDCYLPYLNATAVVDTINNHPKECTSVRVDRTKRLITVDGLTHVVSIVMGDIKNVLKRNSKVDQTVGLTPPQYRVLKHHEAEIVVLPKTCVSSDSSGWV